MATRLRKLSFGEVSLVDSPANIGAQVILFKRADDPDPSHEIPAGNGVDAGAGSPPALLIPGAAGDGKSGVSKMTDEEVKALQDQLANVQAALATEQDKAKAAEAKVTETEKLAKAEQTRIEKAEAELVALRKSHEEAVEKAEIMEFEKRAEADYPYLVGTPAEKGAQLRAVTKMADGPAKTALLETLKRADGAFGSLMREVGKAGKPVTGSAVAELEAKTSEVMQAEPKLSKAEAMTRVMHSNEPLAKRYADEQEAARNGH